MSDDFESKYKKWHTYMSYVKSAVRIITCLVALKIAGYGSAASILAFGFLIAEFIGIAEEWM